MTSRIFGVRLHDIRSDRGLREVIESLLGADRTSTIFPANPEVLLEARADPSYADVLNSADLSLPDGTGVAIVESLRARRRVRRWPGVDLAATLVRIAAERDLVVAFVGGSDGVPEQAAARWRSRIPGISVEVVGPGEAFDDDGLTRRSGADEELVEEIRARAPTIVLVALGAPKQERWISRHVGDFPSARILMGVGGALDMWAGRLPRAPHLLHVLGLEWAWRLALEPRRWRRIVRATIVFPFRALTDRPDRRSR